MRQLITRASISLVAAVGVGGSAPAVADEVAASQQECISKALARPRVERAEMRHAGVPGVQYMFARVNSPEVPEACAESVLRVERYIFKVQDARHRSHWDPGHWRFNTFETGNEGGADSVYITADNSGKGLYRCSRGALTTGAEVLLRMLAQDPAEHRLLGKRTYAYRISKILPRRC
jgi:hypothetical protein